MHPIFRLTISLIIPPRLSLSSGLGLNVKEIDDVANLHPGSDTITTPQRSVGQSPPNTIVACFLQASRLNAIRCRSFKVCSSEVYHSSLAAVKFQEAASKSAEIAE